MEKPTIVIGVETLAILFQGGSVNLSNALLIPDSIIKNAAIYAMNIKNHAMEDILARHAGELREDDDFTQF